MLSVDRMVAVKIQPQKEWRAPATTPAIIRKVNEQDQSRTIWRSCKANSHLFARRKAAKGICVQSRDTERSL